MATITSCVHACIVLTMLRFPYVTPVCLLLRCLSRETWTRQTMMSKSVNGWFIVDLLASSLLSSLSYTASLSERDEMKNENITNKLLQRRSRQTFLLQLLRSHSCTFCRGNQLSSCFQSPRSGFLQFSHHHPHTMTRPLKQQRKVGLETVSYFLG